MSDESKYMIGNNVFGTVEVSERDRGRRLAEFYDPNADDNAQAFVEAKEFADNPANAAKTVDADKQRMLREIGEAAILWVNAPEKHAAYLKSRTEELAIRFLTKYLSWKVSEA